MLKRGLELRPLELGPAEDAARELATSAERGFASWRNGRGGSQMKKKTQSTEMEAVRQRRYAQPDSEISPSNAIPRSTEFDLHPEANWRNACGVKECAFVQDKPGNALWDEKDRP